ncbi:Lrp/AsnC family transcriptional regulator [Rhodococcus sp. HNM0569]|nr:Lrp/AsnC family transcriptional regulator [Rhodococcus sp. HNM0569]
MLSRNARTGIVELASALGVARNTVQARLRRLEDAGLLRGYRPELDLAGIGITVQAFVALTLDQGRLQDVVDALTAIPEVLEIHATTGREDLLVRVATTGHPELQALIQRVVAVPGVTHSDTTLSLTNPLPFRVQPLLAHVTRDAGWGRSTPPRRE